MTELLRHEVEEHQRRLTEAESSIGQLQVTDAERLAHVRALQGDLDDKQTQLQAAQQQLEMLEQQALEMYVKPVQSHDDVTE